METERKLRIIWRMHLVGRDRGRDIRAGGLEKVPKKYHFNTILRPCIPLLLLQAP